MGLAWSTGGRRVTHRVPLRVAVFPKFDSLFPMHQEVDNPARDPLWEIVRR